MINIKFNLDTLDDYLELADYDCKVKQQLKQEDTGVSFLGVRVNGDLTKYLPPKEQIKALITHDRIEVSDGGYTLGRFFPEGLDKLERKRKYLLYRYLYGWDGRKKPWSVFDVNGNEIRVRGAYLSAITPFNYRLTTEIKSEDLGWYWATKRNKRSQEECQIISKLSLKLMEAIKATICIVALLSDEQISEVVEMLLREDEDIND